MPLGKEVGLGPGHIVLDGDPAPTAAPSHFRPMPIVTKRSPISATAKLLLIRGRKKSDVKVCKHYTQSLLSFLLPRQGRYCLLWGDWKYGRWRGKCQNETIGAILHGWSLENAKQASMDSQKSYLEEIPLRSKTLMKSKFYSVKLRVLLVCS